MLPILQICPRSSQTIGNIEDFEFSLVGKIWDGQETVKSQTVWDFPDIWKPGFMFLYLWLEHLTGVGKVMDFTPIGVFSTPTFVFFFFS